MPVLKSPTRTAKEQAIFSITREDISSLAPLAHRERVADEVLINLSRHNPTQGAIARILAEVLEDRDNQWKAENS